jgi:hypothetical protein
MPQPNATASEAEPPHQAFTTRGATNSRPSLGVGRHVTIAEPVG